VSIGSLETAVTEYLLDALIECGRPEPDRVLRYHGLLPHDCCTANGLLVVSWELGYGTNPFPNDSSSRSEPCPAMLTVNLLHRYVMCWPAPKEAINGLIPVDEAWDLAAATLADIANCGARAFLRLQCAPDLSDELQAAVIQEIGRNRFRFRSTAPIPAQGLCAGVEWRTIATPILPVVAS
jgi:hypothetical protein